MPHINNKITLPINNKIILPPIDDIIFIDNTRITVRASTNADDPVKASMLVDDHKNKYIYR